MRLSFSVFRSYLLAAGLECGRILLYRWRPGQEGATGSDWISCGGTDTLYPFKTSARALRSPPVSDGDSRLRFGPRSRLSLKNKNYKLGLEGGWSFCSSVCCCFLHVEKEQIVKCSYVKLDLRINKWCAMSRLDGMTEFLFHLGLGLTIIGSCLMRAE
ncbi:hypothetical protein XENOCAPTIV_031039 [Xenoophorus captivus]|uniref:Uncharacterized protein n=1 Tax=Xenoophorus captivus TaxID=1517983 RepID=A0ABV0SCC8_9TELE